jgi:hypothetical protein
MKIKRKVWATQSNLLPNGKAAKKLTASATENKPPEKVRVKR